ncbi:MAG: phospholipase D family protein [Acidobacteria bacterium]|nr:phospholipase D family protein [Acidobacteriota bacterium]
MSDRFISEAVWEELTRSVKSSKLACHVAVAYFGAGASRLLPLREGSKLVVDASERAVSAGQTCPKDLLALLKRGVRVFSVPNLHAKVYVVGRSAYIGSANVSNYSAKQLLEAMSNTTAPKVVTAARQFVRDLCLHELTPKVLKRLSKIYEPPEISGEKSAKVSQKHRASRPTLPTLKLAQLKLEDWSEREYAIHDKGLATAKKRREHPRTFEPDSFCWVGQCPYQQKDVVIQITNEGKGRVFVSPPGEVLHVESEFDSGKEVSIVFVECPAHRRRRVRSVAKKLGKGSIALLRKNGLVRNRAIAEALLGMWNG